MFKTLYDIIKVKCFDSEIIFLHSQNENLLIFKLKKNKSEFELLASFSSPRQ